MRKAVLFDFDGTLFFGTNVLNQNCFELVLEKMDMPPPGQEKINRTVGMTMEEIVPYLLCSHDERLCRRFDDLLFQCVPEYIAQNIKPIPHEREWLQALRKKAKLAVCTNGDPRYTLPMLKALNIWDCFDRIWTYTPGYTKATAIPVLIEQLAVQDAVFVGDRKMDMDAAHKAGIPIAAIRNEAFPDEVNGADTIAESLEELFADIHQMLDLI